MLAVQVFIGSVLTITALALLVERTYLIRVIFMYF